MYQVYGNGIGGIKHLKNFINCGNSGSSARFFLGLLSTYPHKITISGDVSLRKRPMGRITKNLEKIGANISSKNKKNVKLPIKIQGTNMPLAQKHELLTPSAQVKTAILFSALNTPGITEIVERYDTRDHTELLLKKLGADIKIKKIGNKKIISLQGQQEMNAFKMVVPSDPSSASFFIIQALLTNNSSLFIKNVCINRTRIGFIEILRKMDGKIKFLNKRTIFNETVADIFVKSSKLKGIECEKKIIPRTIDELPSIFIACALAKGQSTFKGIRELRYKESDRISNMEKGLNAFGIKTLSTEDSIKIYGNPKLTSNKKIIVKSNLDHRIAMSFFVMGQVLGGKISIKNFETVNSSFPNFLKLQKTIGSKYEII